MDGWWFMVGSLAVACPLAAQSPESVGTLIVAHGGGSGWNAGVRQVAERVDTGGPVEVSFLMGPEASRTRFQDAAARLVARGADRIVVVPLLVSSHSGHYEQLRYLVGLTDSLDDAMLHHLRRAGIERPAAAVPIWLASGMDAAPEVAQVLAERGRALADTPATRALFIIGHGPSAPDDYAAWMTNVRRLADTVRAVAGFADVQAGLLWDDSPDPVRTEAVRRIRDLIGLQARLTGREVVVVPLLVSRGRVSDEKIPQDLDGLPVIYRGEGLLPHPGITRWIEAQVARAGEGSFAPRTGLD